MPGLFDPLKMGALQLPNRIVMAPLTRSRATPDGRVPTSLQQDYYVQRAGAGLIISEATSVTPRGVGYAATPGIWSDEQTEGWKKIVDAVHQVGGRIVLQLWHVGRVSDPIFLNGALPEAPTPSSSDAIASPVVLLVCAATGPDVSPRVNPKVGVLKSVLLRRASSVIQPNFKL